MSEANIPEVDAREANCTVLYNGDSRWNATTQMRDLIAAGPDSGLSPYLPTLRFLLIDEGSIPARRLDRIGTLLARLFKLENLKSADVKKQVTIIVEQLSPAQLELAAALILSADSEDALFAALTAA